MPLSEVAKTTVVFEVWDWSQLTKSSKVCQVHLPLSQLDLPSESEGWKSFNITTGNRGKVGIELDFGGS